MFAAHEDLSIERLQSRRHLSALASARRSAWRLAVWLFAGSGCSPTRTDRSRCAARSQKLLAQAGGGSCRAVLQKLPRCASRAAVLCCRARGIKRRGVERLLAWRETCFLHRILESGRSCRPELRVGHCLCCVGLLLEFHRARNTPPPSGSSSSRGRRALLLLFDVTERGFCRSSQSEVACDAHDALQYKCSAEDVGCALQADVDGQARPRACSRARARARAHGCRQAGQDWVEGKKGGEEGRALPLLDGWRLDACADRFATIRCRDEMHRFALRCSAPRSSSQTLPKQPQPLCSFIFEPSGHGELCLSLGARWTPSNPSV
eukprot:6206747-Pleurochrysis_carterae.AAC.1